HEHVCHVHVAVWHGDEQHQRRLGTEPVLPPLRRGRQRKHRVLTHQVLGGHRHKGQRQQEHTRHVRERSVQCERHTSFVHRCSHALQSRFCLGGALFSPPRV